MNDGLGKIALDVFFQGCSIKCNGCQNPDLQEENGGFWIDTNEIVEHLKKHKGFYQAIVFLGGEPTEQPEALYNLAYNSGLCNILYTGKIYENLSERIRNVMDIVIDGPYIEGMKTNSFPASRNQRIINKEVK